ncbi:MAG: carbohydrate kinase [Gammaproteobacteria bacterium]|nr:carbohydrate kinase [Gammaproteobacteria bacterium]
MNAHSNASLLIFGEVLFDRFPDGSIVLGGAPFNVARHLQAFGQSPLFISRVGDDSMGRQVKTAMLDWQMDTSGLQLDSAHPTGTVDINFVEGEPQYDIVENRAYDFITYDYLPPLSGCRMLYHGSLALRNHTSHDTLVKLIAQLSAPTFVDINLRSPWYQADRLQPFLKKACWIKLNKDELFELFPDAADINSAIEAALSQLQTGLLIVTLGSEGAMAMTRTGKQFNISPDKTTTVVDTVGAGDAFCSIIMLGQLKSWPIDMTLTRAQDFASAIVGQRGATVNDTQFYQPFIQQWDLN